jgi:hypothetical protein
VRLPYIQLGQKFVTAQAPAVAALLRVPKALVVGMGVELFAFTVEQTSTDERPPDGVFLDPDAGTILEGVMGWTGEPGRLVDSLLRVGVLEKLEIGIRVRGTDRYAAAWEKARKDRERRSVARSRSDVAATSHGSREDKRGQTQTQTQTHKKQLPTTTGAEKPKSADLPQVPDDIAAFAWFQDIRLKLLPGVLQENEPPGYAEWFPRIRDECGGDMARLGRGYVAWCRDRWAQSLKPPAAFTAWMKKCRDFIPPAEVAA